MFERCFQSLMCSSPTVTSMLKPSKLAGADPEVLGIVGSEITYSGVASVRLAGLSRWQWPGSHSMV